MRASSIVLLWIGLALILAALSSCAQSPPLGPTPIPPTVAVLIVQPATPVNTPTAPPPTATQEPLAARVNGKPITLAAFQSEVSRYEAGLASLKQTKTEQPSDYRRQVLDTLIDQILIEDAAAAQHVTVTDTEIDSQVQGSIQDTGGQDKFNAWLQANRWTQDQFRQVLRTQLLTQKMIDVVTANVPTTAEQVHARHILVGTEAEARDVLSQLQAGANFADLARQHSLDPSTRDQSGDLGWFARGQLTTPEVEQAAFALQPGQRSDAIKTALGYDIVEVLERDPSRPLSPDILVQLRKQVFERWLNDLRAKAQIERFVTGS